MTSLVERSCRLVRLVPNRHRRSRDVLQAIGDALVTLPSTARRTITFDRASEFLGCGHLVRNHRIDAYFCDPHSPPPRPPGRVPVGTWIDGPLTIDDKKSGVENTHGRLRRDLPGELDLATITPAHLNEIESLMNSTPRKRLGFRTPQEAFASMVHGRPQPLSHFA